MRGYTTATRADEHGVTHIMANDLGDWWDAACDVPRRFVRRSTWTSRRGADVPTCIACHVLDSRWWEKMR